MVLMLCNFVQSKMQWLTYHCANRFVVLIIGVLEKCFMHRQWNYWIPNQGICPDGWSQDIKQTIIIKNRYVTSEHGSGLYEAKQKGWTQEVSPCRFMWWNKSNCHREVGQSSWATCDVLYNNKLQPHNVNTKKYRIRMWKWRDCIKFHLSFDKRVHGHNPINDVKNAQQIVSKMIGRIKECFPVGPLPAYKILMNT